MQTGPFEKFSAGHEAISKMVEFPSLDWKRKFSLLIRLMPIVYTCT